MDDLTFSNEDNKPDASENSNQVLMDEEHPDDFSDTETVRIQETLIQILQCSSNTKLKYDPILLEDGYSVYSTKVSSDGCNNSYNKFMNEFLQ